MPPVAKITVTGTYLDISDDPLEPAVQLSAEVQVPADRMVVVAARNTVYGSVVSIPSSPYGVASLELVFKAGVTYRVTFGSAVGHLKCDDWAAGAVVPFTAIKDLPGSDDTVDDITLAEVIALLDGKIAAQVPPAVGPALSTQLATPGSTARSAVDGRVQDYLDEHGGGGGGSPKAPVQVADYVTADGVTDDSAGVMEAYALALAEGRVLEFPDKLIAVAATLTLGSGTAAGNSGQLVKWHIRGGRFTTTADADIAGPAVRLEGCFEHDGVLEVDAAGRADIGLEMGRCGRSIAGKLHAANARAWGIFVPAEGNNNAVSVAAIRARGSGTKVTRTLTATATTGGGSFSATTRNGGGWREWTLDTPVPAHFVNTTGVRRMVDFVYDQTNGRHWIVYDFPDTSTVRLMGYNSTVPAGTQFTADIACGGGLCAPEFGDSGIWQVGSIDIRDNPNGWGMHWGGTYGMAIGQLALQNNWRGLASSKYWIGLSAASAYFEATGAPLVLGDGANTRAAFGPGPKTDIGLVDIVGQAPLVTQEVAARRTLPNTISWHDAGGGGELGVPPITGSSTEYAYPGKRYVRVGDTNMPWHLENKLEYAANGRNVVTFDVTNTSTGGLHRLFTIYPRVVATDTINGSTWTLAAPFTIPLPPGHHRIVLYRVDTDWRVWAQYGDPDTAEPMISDTSTHQAWPGQRYDRRGDNAFLFKLQNRADMGHRRTVEFWLTNTNSGSTSRNFSIWPESQPSETIDGGTYSSGSPFTIALPPGPHYVRLSRDGSDWKSFRK